MKTLLALLIAVAAVVGCSTDADVARATIAAKFGLNAYQVMA